MLFYGFKLCKDYLLNASINHKGPYLWWSISTFLIVFVNFEQVFGFISYKLKPKSKSFITFFKFIAYGSALPLFIYWVLIFITVRSYDSMNFDKDLDLNYTTNIYSFVILALLDLTI